MLKSNLKAHIALFLVNALYGAGHIIAKGVMPDYLSPNVFILLRVTGATILFWILYLLFSREKIDRKDVLLLAFCGLFGVAINQLFFFNGLNLSSSVNSGIIMTVNPILVVILSFFVLKEKLTSFKIFGILLGATGAILLTLSSGRHGNSTLLGDTFLFINALSYAVYLIISKPLMKKYSPLTVVTYVFTFGLLFVLVFPLTIQELGVTDFSIIPEAAWWKIVYIILGVTFFTYLLTMYGLKYLSASISSSYIFFQPVLLILFIFLLSFFNISEDYSHTITADKFIYMGLIFGGVYLVSKSK
ncbi:MAG: DMT family transporter [Bacteroidota bacterium]